MPVSLTRIGTVWLAMAVAMTLNGMAREVVLKRAMQAPAASALSAILGMTLIAGITYWGFRPLAASSLKIAQLALLSVLLVILTIAFECAMGRLVDHKSWRELLEHYAVWRGELWPVVLLWLASMPFIWARR